MKPAITLHQPFATLMILGEKKIDTRPWKWRYRGRIWIHASVCRSMMPLCAQPLIAAALKRHALRPDALPFGAVLGDVDKFACIATEILTSGMTEPLTLEERAFGGYDPGRYGFLCRDPKPLRVPISARGKQGVWHWAKPVR